MKDGASTFNKHPMNFAKYSFDRIELLVDRAKAVRDEDEELSDFLLEEARCFADAMDSGDDLFYVRDLRKV